MSKLKINSKKTFTYLVVIGILVLFHFVGLTSGIESFVSKTLNPVLKILYSSGSKIRSFYGETVDKRDYNLIIAELERINREKTAENAKLKIIEEENDYLKKQIDFRKNNNYKFLIAEIISRNDLVNNSSEEKSIVINKGQKDGIINGLVLLDAEGIVVGKIIEARDNFSKACLTVDKKCKFAATVQNSDRTSGIVEGDLGLTIKMDLVPQTENLEKGNIIVTSGLEDNIPRGLVIGTVSEAIKENNNLWQRAVIEPLDDSENLIMVSVIIP